MKKKSRSQSAFFNLRVLIGLNVFLAGVFLALFAMANPSGGRRLGFASTTGAGPAGSDPVIAVTPDSLSVTLQQGQMESRILTIANLGGATLNWDQFGGKGCVLPSQWVSAQPFGGSIPPGQSQEMTVTFNATNILSGEYTATLCLTSNDPVRPMVTVPLSLTVTAGEGVTILFNQLMSVAGIGQGMPVQLLVPPNSLDAEGADDFEVFDAEGWTIGEFVFGLPGFGFVRNPGLVDIRVYPDASGEPGEPAVCSYDGIAATQHGTVQTRVPLPTPCALGPGRYWVSLQPRDAFLRWSVAFHNPFPPPFVLGAHAHWRNPSDGWGTGCTDWSDITTCLVDGEPIAGTFESNALFQVCGVVTGHGDAVGCGNENAAINLAVTLAEDNGDPDQCGAATTLDVDTGTRVNVCYKITNTGNATLSYHWLRESLKICGGPCVFTTGPGRVGFEPLRPGETLQFNRLMTATGSQVIAGDWEATDVQPWYFPAVEGFDFVDISNSGTPLNLDDDGSANVTMPFRFDLFGASSDQLCINNNGFMLFDWSRPCDGFHQTLGIPTDQVRSTGMIAPFWDDLFTGGNVYYDVVGEAPNRRFIVQWNQKNHYNNGQSDPGGVTFEVILDETTNTISFQYLNTIFGNAQHPEWDRGGRASSGFQQFVGEVFVGGWIINSNLEPVLDPNSGLTWGSTGYFHARASATATLNVNAPAIAVSPESLEATVEQGGTTSAPLTIANTGQLNLLWQVGESPLGSRSHFPSGPAPMIAEGKVKADGNVDLWDRMPEQKLKLRVNRASREGSQPSGFLTEAFAVRVAQEPPFGFRYDRFNDITNPGDTQEIASLHGLNAFAGAFMGTDFSREFAIDDINASFFTIDTATGEQSLSFGSVRGAPEILPNGAFRGMTWDATTNTLYAVGTDTFGIFNNTRFFLARIDMGHEVVATTVGELPGIAQGVALFGIAVDPIGRMFGVDILGDRLFAIDKDTAEATPIGSLGFNANGIVGMAFDDVASALYLAAIDDVAGIGNLYTLDTVTGDATVVGQMGDGSQHYALAIASGAPCVPPTEVPWLSLDPASGSIPPGNNDEVTVHMDASDLTPGTYHADVCVGSNDPVRPLVAVPVTLTVTGGGTPTPTPTVTPTATPTASPTPTATPTVTPTPTPTATPRPHPTPRRRPTPRR